MIKDNEMRIQSFITASPETYYQEACVRKNLCQPDQHVVVDFHEWLNWYNAADTHNPQLPIPVFVGDSLAIVMKVAQELNAGIKI
jgi:hypothetical protein